MKTNSIGILSIATNDYLKYWKEMAKSIDISTQGKNKVTLHLFTDQPVIADSFASTLGKCKVKIYTTVYGGSLAVSARVHIHIKG